MSEFISHGPQELASWRRSGLVSPFTPQYMMLSGQVPFQGASGQGGQSQAAEIMCKIDPLPQGDREQGRSSVHP